MYELLLVIYLVVALAVIGLVLIQQGKGADMGASFGAGSSNTLFGSSGAGNFLTRSTSFLATVFFVLSLLLGNLSADQVKQQDEWSELGGEAEVPAVVTEPSEVPVQEQPAGDVPN